jgi:hypothetical protein
MLSGHRLTLAPLFCRQVIMATNRIDILDSALLRPGRIDRKIEFPPPGPEARISILRIHSRKMSLQRGINFRSLAEKMGNCSGAEVRGICTEAGACPPGRRRRPPHLLASHGRLTTHPCRRHQACTRCGSDGSTSAGRTLRWRSPRSSRRMQRAARRSASSSHRRPTSWDQASRLASAVMRRAWMHMPHFLPIAARSARLQRRGSGGGAVDFNRQGPSSGAARAGTRRRARKQTSIRAAACHAQRRRRRLPLRRIERGVADHSVRSGAAASGGRGRDRGRRRRSRSRAGRAGHRRRRLHRLSCHRLTCPRWLASS